jgi:cellulase/cellobiase CelA1
MSNANGRMSNGRINIMGPNTSTLFSMMDKIPINTNTNYQNVLAGNFMRSPLSDSYFSKQNIQYIQNGIKQGVYTKSQKRISVDDQPEDQIVTVMRSMYLQYSKNLDSNIQEQVNDLNSRVLNFCINNVFNEAVAYLKYREDASTMHIPIMHPIYSNKTNKVLEQKPWF